MIVVHESLVCSEQFNCLLFIRKILQLPQILWFSSIFVYLNPFQQWLYDFEIHLFTPRTTEGLIHNYYRRFKHSPMLQKEKHVLRAGPLKTLNRMRDWWIFFFLFCLNIIFCSFSTALQKLQKIVTMFHRRQIKLNLSWILNSKSFSRPALNAWFVLLEHSWVFESSVIVVYEVPQ